MLRLTCLALLISLSLGLELKAQIKDHWQSFKAAHKKSYSAGEETVRQENFKKSVETVLNHNLKSDLEGSNVKLGINKFSDLSMEEFAQKMMGWKESNRTVRHYEKQTQSRRDIYVPASLDYRDRKVVNTIRDQGVTCGSCWAFLTVSSLESHYALATGILYSLSEQNLIDCDKTNLGCDGGNVNDAYDFIIRNKGLDQAACYPYTMHNDVCSFKPSCVAAKMEAYADVRQGDEIDLLVSLVTKGPIALAIDAHNDQFRYYRVGVMNPPSCSSTKLSHGVLLVGYGVEDGQEYWLIRNSWGDSWGQGGYGKMAKNAGNKCGVATAASYPIIKL